MNRSRRRFLIGSAGAAAILGGAGFFVPPKRRFTGGVIGPDRVLGHRMRDGSFPAPDAAERTQVVIVGGGIAGLAAARELLRNGVDEFILLELEAHAGGNSRSGANEVSAFPWGAHYVPLPGPEAHEVAELFTELGVITGRDAAGRAIYREEFLCHDPVERLFVHGRWQEGIIPQLGLKAEERSQLTAFLARTEALKESRGDDGRPAFAIPVERSSADPQLRGLDRITLGDWLQREGFTAAPLRWYVDYCCRDDFGQSAAQVSAWAGLHYFAARNATAANASPQAVLTWPEGNGWLVHQLRRPVGRRVRPSCAVFRIDDSGARVGVEYFDAVQQRSGRLEADRVILATPRFISERWLPPDPETRPALPTYAPWLVANLTLDSLPTGRGAPLAWDNVMYDSRSLGYVVATHQHLHPFPRATVLTYYLPLDHTDPAAARKEALVRPWSDWCELILADLRRAHPDLTDHLVNLDVMVWGHGMVSPTPGSLWGRDRALSGRPRGRLHFAHSDLSGISLFEEAYIHGVRAATEVTAALA